MELSTPNHLQELTRNDKGVRCVCSRGKQHKTPDRRTHMTITKIRKATVKLDQQFNDMPGREKIEELLVHYLGQNGVSKYTVVNLPEKKWWSNKEDTLVIAITNEEVWRFGADASMQFAINLANFRNECGADEFNVEKKGRHTIIRFWWD